MDKFSVKLSLYYTQSVHFNVYELDSSIPFLCGMTKFTT